MRLMQNALNPPSINWLLYIDDKLKTLAMFYILVISVGAFDFSDCLGQTYHSGAD